MGSVTGYSLLKAILILWLQTSLVFTEAANSLSKDEYFALRRHLKSLNKPAIKSIETGYGNIFDCVDINKQPAFDHPLLKNHTIQMKPSSLPDRNDDQIFSSSVLDIGVHGEGCPDGTVPIRRVTMEDLMRAPSVSEFGKKYVLNDSQVIFAGNTNGHHHWANDQTYPGEFYGTQVTMNVWQPNVAYSNKFSLGQFWVSNGPYDQLNTIEAGWVADGYHNTGCYNLICPGFIQVSNKVPLGAYFTQVSTYGGEQHEITLLSFLDHENKVWWLSFGNELVGYWPQEIFNTLSTKAQWVHWGGEVYNPDEKINQLKSDMPPMGSGHFAQEEYGKSSFMRALQVVTVDNVLVEAPAVTFAYADAPKCYNITDKGRLGEGWRRTFYFGGPGGNCN
ncbi:protein neprosin-like [Aristolochia californica]|uniref:protein neprosin-like n=1 Tax=Aristolochia californica TaxID=171875 RepID=UPI0035E04320